MVRLTPAAAEQIRESARISDAAGLPLRIAVAKNPDGTLHYAPGFDDVGGTDDIKVQSEGVDMIIAQSCVQLAEELTVDYVKLDSGEMAFVFVNPQDPNYAPASE